MFFNQAFTRPLSSIFFNSLIRIGMSRTSTGNLVGTSPVARFAH
jgi:hypothetical protein